MTVVYTDVKEILETTPSAVTGYLRTYLDNLVSAFASTPVYTTIAPNLDNIGVTKATPSNGIITFSFIQKGITISISYRND